jgi:sporulation protein YlmC with PRC-barrel domain
MLWVSLLLLGVSSGGALAAELIGAPVFAADGTRVGEVSDISSADDGRVDGIRITTEAPLGFGERAVQIPRGAFTIIDNKVVLELSRKELGLLPSAPEAESHE